MRVALLALSFLLIACTGKPPIVTGGPIGPTVKNVKPVPAPQIEEPSPATGFQPGEILVKPAPGVTEDDLKKRFGADNVRPFTPEGIDESLRAEFNLDEWFIIKVPEGEEVGIAGGLVEKGDIVGDVRLSPKRGNIA